MDGIRGLGTLIGCDSGGMEFGCSELMFWLSLRWFENVCSGVDSSMFWSKLGGSEISPLFFVLAFKRLAVVIVSEVETLLKLSGSLSWNIEWNSNFQTI